MAGAREKVRLYQRADRCEQLSYRPYRPRNLVDDPQKLEETKAKLNLDPSCDRTGFGNLLPCKPGVNGQIIDRFCFWIRSFGKHGIANEGKVSWKRVS
jgi:hypothetical protein